MAQGILAPPPTGFSGLSPELQTTGTNLPGVLPPMFTPQPPSEPLAQWGPVQFRPHLLYRFLYGDGIPAQPGQHLTTAINEIYPGILINLGSHWNLDYTPTLRFYSNRQFQDTTDQAVTLAGGTVFRDWTFGFSQSYASSSQPLIETGAQTDLEVFSTSLSARYPMNSVLTLDLGASQTFSYVDQTVAGEALTDSKTWLTQDWLDYQFAPKISAGVGVGFGYDNLSVGTDMTFEQLQGRVTWRPGEKLSLLVSAGVEDLQFVDAHLPDVVEPIFGVTVSYQIFEATALSLAAARTVNPSFFENQITKNTTVAAGLRQRFFENFYLEVGGGYEFSGYSASASGADVNREDNGVFANVKLSTLIWKRITAAAFYVYTENSSSQSRFDVSSSQVGFELGYHF
jgi:hypothetical protein